MKIEEVYQSIMEDLKAGGRGLRRWETHELKHLAQALAASKDAQQLEKLLCIIEHSASFYPGFETPLLEILTSQREAKLLVFALNAARKHILAWAQQQGRRLEYPFLQTLKTLLYHRDPEVVEWTLRTIEEMGSQGIIFKKEFAHIKPPPWKWFNQHQRSVREIIAMLEHRWSQS